jgi:signal transduction histidine kinase
MPSRLNQVFLNLLVNAGQSIDGNGRITISTGVDQDEAWIAVADTGCGIPAENLNRIFDPFFTTKPVGQGTGLGLSVSHAIVRKHGGRIDVESEPGRGTRFIVRLPLTQSRAPAPESEAPGAA